MAMLFEATVAIEDRILESPYAVFVNYSPQNIDNSNRSYMPNNYLLERKRIEG